MTTSSESNTWTRIAATARGIGVSESPAAVFRQLVEISAAVVPRAAIYLVRQGRIQGWGSFGYDEQRTRRQQAYRAPANAGWLGRLASTAPAGHVLRGTDDDDPDFGQAPAAQTAGFVLPLAGKPVAILVAERDEGQTPWKPAIIEVLVTLARLRLELSLASRSAAASRPKPAARPGPAVRAEVEPAPDQRRDPAVDAARRYARLVATDIRLYNEEAVMLGRRNGDLVDRLGTHLGRGKETFLRRHAELGDEGLEILHDAYVQVLAAGDASLIPAKLD